MIWLYREDVFKKHNLAVPKTYEELHQVLKKLKELYPESYPLSMRFGQIPDEMMANLTTNFGSGTDVYYNFDEEKMEVRPDGGQLQGDGRHVAHPSTRRD
ncbi:hypothetical protein VQ056_05980 [Paenibacillus sp. JTLBN-2024]